MWKRSAMRRRVWQRWRTGTIQVPYNALLLFLTMHTAVESANVALNAQELDDQMVPFPPLFPTDVEVPTVRRQRDTLTVESESSALIGEWMNSIMSEALVCCRYLLS